MSHDPSHWDKILKKHKTRFHLTLSGHTHGMQFGIEIPGLIKWSPVKWAYKYWAGMYNERSQYLNVNRGFTSSDVEKFLVRFSNFVRETEPGTYDFGYFISQNGKKVNLVEKYYTSDDFVHHLNNFEKSDYSKEFLKLFTINKVIIAGNASDELKTKGKGYGAELRLQVGGWIN